MVANDMLNEFPTITLKEIHDLFESDRYDTNFILSAHDYGILMQNISSDYRILQISGQINQSIDSFYFDTSEFRCFHDFQRGKRSFHIIRKLYHLDSQDFFLEIESKDKLGKTNKARKVLEAFEPIINEEDLDFIKKKVNSNDSLESKIQISYDRSTLVNKDFSERITIDSNFLFTDEFGSKPLKDLHLICIRRESRNHNSKITSVLKEKLHRPISFSKYCTGLITLDHAIKMNNYKASMIKIQKISK